MKLDVCICWRYTNYMDIFPFSKVTGFDWDEHNTGKNRIKHAVDPGECEEMFFNMPLVVAPDISHSSTENRYHALGSINAGRRLLIVFTVRNQKIRVISARDQSRKERLINENHKKNAT